MTSRIQKTILFLFLGVLLVSFWGCTEERIPPGATHTFAEITDFREIPGLTQEEIAAIEKLIASRKSFSATIMIGSDSFYAENGELDGFSRQMYEWLSGVFKIPFTPVVAEWNKLLDGLESLNYDFSVDIPTQWRDEGRYYATDAIVERGVRLFANVQANRMVTRQANRPLRYGHLNGLDKNDHLSAYMGRRITLIPVPTLAIAQEMLLAGELDGFIGAETNDIILTSFSTTEPVPGLPYNTVSLATCNPELKPIISAVQKCLQAGSGYHLSKMHEKSMTQYLRVKLLRTLTPQEKAYLNKHQDPSLTIPVGISYDNYPFSFYNEQDFAWQGITVDLLAEVEKVTGMRFMFANSTITTWPTILSMLESGSIAMTTELLRSPERQGNFLWASRPALTDYYALLSMAGFPDVNVSQVSLLRVGLISGTAYAEAFHEMFPDHKHISYYDTNMEAFKAMEAGDVDLLMMTRTLLLNVTNYKERGGFKANLVFKRPYASYFGFNKKEELLCSVVSKTLLLLNMEQISDAWTRKVFDYRGKLARERVPYLVAVSGLLLLVLALLSFLFVRSRKMGEQLVVSVQEKTLELQKRTKLSYTDKLTGIYNRSKFDEEILACCEKGRPFCVLLMDIDHFKKVNDTYGHLIGDRVLTSMVSIISGNVRSNDVFARWGGEEFVLLLQRVGNGMGPELAERIRRQIEESSFDVVGHITVSIGVSAYKSGDTPTSIMERTDEALYKSKNSGRNTVTIA